MNNIDLQKLLFRQNTTDKIIFDVVYNKNEYPTDSLNENSIVVDIGAHVGSFSLKAYSIGVKQIFAFEPNKENYIVCNYNCSPYNIKVFNNAVRGNYRLPKVGSRIGNNIESQTIKNMGGLSVTFGEQIDVITLEDIVSIVGGKIDLLKIDCEGSEYPIIFESNKEIFKNINIIVGEYHPGTLPIHLCEGFENCPENLENYLKSLNYDTVFTRKNKTDFGNFICRRS